MVLNISCIRSFPIDRNYNSPISFGQVFILAETHVIAKNVSTASGGGYYADYDYGGGIYVYDSSSDLSVINSTIYYNSADFGGGIFVEDGTVTILNSILWANNVDQIAGNAEVTYSDVQDGYEGDGNINVNPIFNGCLQILPGSQCIDAGNPDFQYNDVCLPPSLGGVRNDMGAHGGPGACQACVADFSASPTKGVAPLIVNFTNQSTGTVDSWNWSFGDGSTSNEKNPSHTYTDHGAYNVTLTVTCLCLEGSYKETKTDHIKVAYPFKAMPWIPLLLLDE